jgi:hypothetical protein
MPTGWEDPAAKESARQAMLDDLARSGLDAADAQAAGLEVVSAEEAKAHGHPYASSDYGYIIPYPEPYSAEYDPATATLDEKFAQYHEVRWLGDRKAWESGEDKGKPMPKTSQPRDSGNTAYVPAGLDLAALLADPSIAVAPVEGAKKALALAKHGIPAVGFKGCQSWHAAGTKTPLPVLCQLAAGGRPMPIGMDGDKLANPEVAQGERELADGLTKAGGRPTLMRWDPAYKGVDDLLVGAGLDAVKRGIEEAKPASRGDLSTRWAPKGSLFNVEPPPKREWIWEHRIPLIEGGRVGIVVGPGDTGKTALLAGLAVHRALWGRCPEAATYLGKTVRPGKTVFVSAEDGSADYRYAFHAQLYAAGLLDDAGRASPADVAILEGRIAFLDLVGLGIKLARTSFGSSTIAEDDVPLLVEAIAKRAGSAPKEEGLLVIFETASRFGEGEDNEDHSALIAALEQVARQVADLIGAPVSVLITTHVAKQVAREGTDDQYAGRGGSAISDNARFAINLMKAPRKVLDDQFGEGVVQAAEAERLLTLNVAKANAVRPEDRGICIVERCTTPYAAALRQYRAPDIKETQRRTAAEARVQGEALVRAVRALKAQGVSGVTERRLRDNLQLHSIPKGKLTDAITRAVADGYLAREANPGRGGGERLVVVERPEAANAAA